MHIFAPQNKYILIMSLYETVFILTPVLSDEQAKEAVKKIEGEVKTLKGKVRHSESWGLRKLAYPIQKKSTGFYFLMEFQVAGENISTFELMMKRDERVLRFLTVKMDSHHEAYAEKRRAKKSGKETAVEA